MAFIIQAHKSPMQVSRLLSALNYPGWDIYLHVDAKANISDFLDVIIPDGQTVNFVKSRVNVNWGGFSQVKATLNAIQEVVASGFDYKYVHLISGQDYPVKELSIIDKHFTEHEGSEYINIIQLPSDSLFNGGLDRVLHYHFLELWGRKYRRIDRAISYILPHRQFPKGFDPYGGASWWSLTLDCIRFISEASATNQKYQNYFKYVSCPDEHFFQTLIMNSRFSSSVVNMNYRYVDWTDKINYPKILCSEDFTKLDEAESFFARKFDIKYDSHILDLIDAQILKKVQVL